MKTVRLTANRRPGRRGAALVEFAIILPVLLLLLVGSIEIGRGISVHHRCAEAARAGARVFSMRKSKTESDIRAIVDQIMSENDLENYVVTLTPNPASAIRQLDPVTVTVSIAAGDASWYPTPWFLAHNTTISSSSSMPADLGESSGDGILPDVIPVAAGALLDEDAVDELGGVNDADLKELEKEAKDLVKDARKLRKKADKSQEDATDAEAKAKSGKVKDIEKALEKRAEADQAAREATAAEQLAREALQRLSTATSGRFWP